MAEVLTYLWFDVEDYVTPEADEPPKKIIEILSRHSVGATIKVVAEKIRALEARNRMDVIESISKMDVGYHLDTHSRHPTLYEYLADKDVRDGAAKFLCRENSGCNFVKNKFNRHPSCLGHPGPIWAPHVYPAMHDMGIPVYLDETSILNLDDSPYWYCNVLNLNGANRNFINLDYFFERPDGLERTKGRFKAIYKRLSARGGAISILFHLHTIINKKFWDEVNFAHGRNPPDGKFVMPPRQPAEVTERAYRDFQEFVEYAKSFGNVRFITAHDAVSIFQDTSTQLQISLETLARLAQQTMRQIRHQVVYDACLSPAQIFHIATKAAAAYAESNTLPQKLTAGQPLGPLSSRSTKGPRKLSTIDLLDASKEVLKTTDETGHIPSEIRIGQSTLRPEDYLATACSLLVLILRKKKTPDTVVVRRGHLAQKRYINSRAFAKACRWVMLPESFRAPKILEQILLQTWTLKPAFSVSSK